MQCKDEKRRIRRKMKYKLNIKNKLIRLLIIVQTVMLWQLPVYAKGGLKKTKLFNKLWIILNLLNDYKLLIVSVEGIIATVLYITEGVKKQAATDPQEEAQHKKKMNKIIITAFIIMCASGLITTLLSYYE